MYSLHLGCTQTEKDIYSPFNIDENYFLTTGWSQLPISNDVATILNLRDSNGATNLNERGKKVS